MEDQLCDEASGSDYRTAVLDMQRHSKGVLQSLAPLPTEEQASGVAEMATMPAQASIEQEVPIAAATANPDASSSRVPSVKSGKRKARQASAVQSSPPLAAQPVLAVKPKRVKQVARRALPQQETGQRRQFPTRSSAPKNPNQDIQLL
jgi:hypothetical protein